MYTVTYKIMTATGKKLADQLVVLKEVINEAVERSQFYEKKKGTFAGGKVKKTLFKLQTVF